MFIFYLEMENSEKFVKCNYVDEDPQDLCHPVNCPMKYGGYRNVFDTTKHQCIQSSLNESRSNGNFSGEVIKTMNDNFIKL